MNTPPISPEGQAWIDARTDPKWKPPRLKFPVRPRISVIYANTLGTRGRR